MSGALNMLSRHLGFQRVIFDCDSTLVTVEGIDELARLKSLSDRIAELTRLAMEGVMPLEKVYAERLELLQPTRAELTRVGRIYRHTLVPDAAQVVAALQAVGVEVFIVSGGLKASVLALALALKIPATHVHAVAVELDPLQGVWWDYARHRFAGNPDERYLAFAPTPLAESNGKVKVVRDLSVNARTLMVGDGSTDLVTKSVAKLFVGFGGVERRTVVVNGAEVFIDAPGLASILPLALSRRKGQQVKETNYEAVFARGVDDIVQGKVQFKRDELKERVMRAHGATDGELVEFGE